MERASSAAHIRLFARSAFGFSFFLFDLVIDLIVAPMSYFDGVPKVRWIGPQGQSFVIGVAVSRSQCWALEPRNDDWDFSELVPGMLVMHTDQVR